MARLELVLMTLVDHVAWLVGTVQCPLRVQIHI
jgi:hypothetical protein